VPRGPRVGLLNLAEIKEISPLQIGFVPKDNMIGMKLSGKGLIFFYVRDTRLIEMECLYLDLKSNCFT